ncbi:uncharacterized protein HRG_04450 [Hirsutella rhossiliensis]|uniref:Uncharacterized protein n=1 Tax=Hirsutella rhossiliensis TaxID=111463 RepID=A0A9P8MZ80_9HYPO|nr:uncharacterized protein HRG_04450 [Hirsutella rhossiliensis]KAH0964022.1 hypothetical protein HRG_04450 [Hirsutella rhossiliensis]
MTHGPPHGILDYTFNGQRAGCSTLFQAVYNARPKIHCFGHIHEAWGCYLASWMDYSYTAVMRTAMAGSHLPIPTWENSIDAAMSRLSTLTDLEQIYRSFNYFPPGPEALGKLVDQQSIHIDLTEGHSRLEHGRQTLFVNAAINDFRYNTTQRPFLVDVYLDKDEGQEVIQDGPTGEALADEILKSAAAAVANNYSTDSTLP